MKTWLATALAIGLFLASCVPGAPTETPTPTPPPADRPASGVDDVLGAWEAGNRRLLLREDGTFWGINIWDAEQNGSFDVEGATLSIRHTGHFEGEIDVAVPCDEGKAGTYEIQVVAGANLRFSTVQDDCAQRADFMAHDGDREWEPALAPGPITARGDLAGVYVREGGQYAQFTADGTFACALSRLDVEKDPDCRGEVAFEGSRLSVEVDQCPSGSTGIYQAMRLDNGHLQFEMVEEDECAWRAEFLIGPGSFATEFEPTR